MGGLLLSVVWWAAAIVALVCVVALVRPIKRLGLGTRRHAGAALASMIVVIALIAVIPPRMTTIAAPVSRLDEVAPKYHFAELHARHINATPDRVYDAMKRVTANEIRSFQTLTWIRRFGRPLPDNILNAPEGLPILDVATRSGFVLLFDEPPRELVVGTVVVAPASARGLGPLTANLYRRITAPGFVLAAMNFGIAPEGTGSRITTETRITATDPTTIRLFTPYWRTILPGSWLIRLGWLEAIARRAESGAS